MENPTGLHLTCPCGESFDRDDLTSTECADILEIWHATHDGTMCRVTVRINAFYNKVKDYFNRKW